MNERVLILRDAVVKITQMLSGKGINVTQRGINAYVKSDRTGRPVQVNLPYLPDNATEELCMAIQGFLDHEVAHILFTDFALLEEANKTGAHSMFNMIEDARIEKAMAKRFAGSGHNLSVTGEFFLNKFTLPSMRDATAAGNTNGVIAVLMVPLIRAMSGQFTFKEFMKDKMHIVQPVYDKIADLESQLENCASSREALDLAKEIEGRLRSAAPKGKGKPKDEDEGEEGEEGDGEAKSAKGKVKKASKPKKGEEKPKGKGEEEEEKEEKPKSESKKGGKSKSEEEEKDEEEGAGEGEGEEEKSEEEEGGSGKGEEEKPEEEEEAPTAPGEEEGEGEDEESGPSEEEDEEEGEGEGASGEGEDDGEDEEDTSNTAAIWEEIDKDGKNGFDEAMSRIITNAAAESAKHSDYLVYTKEADVIEPLHVGSGYDSRMLTDLIDKVDHMVGPLQKDLERAIAARSLATWEAGRRSGRLHAANLSRLAVGDGRVFRKRHETTSKDVAVSLVIDCSGSMSGSKIYTATQAAYALSSVMERIGISHEVVAFTTGQPCADYGTLEAETKKIGRGFTRIEALYMPIIKGFNERLKTEVKERFGWLPNCRILRNNIDGECVEIAARRLMARRESGKVMIVLSDGAPACQGDMYALQRHLKQVVKNVEKAGVKTVGIGIRSSEVTKFYPKNIVLNNVAELPDRVIKELRHLLVG